MTKEEHGVPNARPCFHVAAPRNNLNPFASNMLGSVGYVKAASPETVFNQLLGKFGIPRTVFNVLQQPCTLMRSHIG